MAQGNLPDFRALFESAPGLYLVLTPDLTIVAVSNAYLRATMTQREAILGKGLFEVFPDNPADPKADGTRNLAASLRRVLAGKVADTMAVQKYDIRRPEAEGGGFEERYWSPVNSPVFGAAGEVTHIIHRVEDVSELVRLKHDLARADGARKPAPAVEGESLARSVFVGLGAVAIAAGGSELLRALTVPNPAPGLLMQAAVIMAAFFGGMRSGLIAAALLSIYGIRVYGLVPDSLGRMVTFAVLSPLLAVLVGILHRRLVHQARASARALADAELELERRVSENALRVREDKFRAAIEASLDSFILLDALRDGKGAITDFRVAQVNTRMLKMLGKTREEFVGARLSEAFPHVGPDGFLAEYTRVIETQQPSTREFQTNALGAEPKWLYHQVVPLGDGVAIFDREIGEQKKLEEQLRQSQKMESVGRLAGGVAHDFNNLLTVIIGYANLASAQVKPGQMPMVENALKYILTASGRAADLTRQLLAFARRQVIEPRVLDLNEVISEAEKMLVRVIGEDVALSCKLAKDLWSTKADPGQLTQVLMNLSINARDAMPKGGKLTIETSNVTLDEAYCRNHAEVKPGEYVLLAVSDTGSGMDEETKKHLFEPFFTTKATGKGTGLGLATSYGIVRQNGGHLWYYSELGLGTTFKIYLPRAAGVEAAAPAPAAPPSSRGQEIVLLVEDESMVREYSALTLRAQGYQVVHAPGAAEALAKFEATARIDLLVTDVVMPGMSGKELAEKLRLKQPGLKVLFTSGYTANVIVHHGVLDDGVQFLPKPFTPTELAKKVREVLDGAAT